MTLDELEMDAYYWVVSDNEHVFVAQRREKNAQPAVYRGRDKDGNHLWSFMDLATTHVRQPRIFPAA